MKWRLIEVPDEKANDDDLTDDELIGVSVLLTHRCGEPHEEKLNIYWRARQKIQYAVEAALGRDHER